MHVESRTMDLNKVLAELRAERAKLEVIIEQLEELGGTGADTVLASRSRRGRKSMSDAERREVSARMKKYWASRRKAQVAV